MGKLLTESQSVQEFYRAFKQDEFIENGTPSFDLATEKNRVDLKMKLIAEEFFELVEAIYNKESSDRMKDTWNSLFSEETVNPEVLSIVDTADALADLLYVIHGFAIETGIPLDDVFREVHASNMSKLDENGEPIFADGITPIANGTIPPAGKILKGKNYFKPDVKGVLFE